MKTVWKKHNNIEIEKHSEPKIDLGILRKRSNAKTHSGIILGYMKKARNDENPELAKLFQEIYKQMIELETSVKVRLNSWRGKSGIKIFERPDRFIIIRWQKQDKGGEAKEIRSEILKEDVNDVIYWINKLSKDYKNIPTKEIGRLVYRKKWTDVFSNRPEHIQLTLILNILEYYGITHYYRSGYTKVLREVRDIQTALK